MPDAFIQKLSGHGTLSEDDILLLEVACGRPQNVPARTDLIREGDRPGPLFVILDGWTCRYKLLPEGTRQITAMLMPGDVFDQHAFVLARRANLAISQSHEGELCPMPLSRS